MLNDSDDESEDDSRKEEPLEMPSSIDSQALLLTYLRSMNESMSFIRDEVATIKADVEALKSRISPKRKTVPVVKPSTEKVTDMTVLLVCTRYRFCSISFHSHLF